MPTVITRTINSISACLYSRLFLCILQKQGWCYILYYISRAVNAWVWCKVSKFILSNLLWNQMVLFLYVDIYWLNHCSAARIYLQTPQGVSTPKSLEPMALWHCCPYYRIPPALKIGGNTFTSLPWPPHCLKMAVIIAFLTSSEREFVYDQSYNSMLKSNINVTCWIREESCSHQNTALSLLSPSRASHQPKEKNDLHNSYFHLCLCLLIAGPTGNSFSKACLAP